MKNIGNLLIIIGILSMQTSFAQREMRPRLIEASFFGGPTIMWASPKTDKYENEGVKIGGVYGVGVDINLVQTMQNYYFSTGINARHIRTGLSFSDNYILSDTILQSKYIRSTYNMVYITIPTTIKLQTDPIGRFIIFGTVGLDNGFCVSSKSKDKVENQQEYKEVDNYKKTLFFREALLASIGFDFIIKGNTKASFTFAFNNGFTNAFRKSYKNAITGEQVKANNRGFEFQFGFIF